MALYPDTIQERLKNDLQWNEGRHTLALTTGDWMQVARFATVAAYIRNLLREMEEGTVTV